MNQLLKILWIALVTCPVIRVSADPAKGQADVRMAPLDEGRFYIYTSIRQKMPFIPYGCMPEGMAKNIELNPRCKENPLNEPSDNPKDGDTCISLKIARWTAPFWCGVAFLSGPAGTPGDSRDPAWLCEQDRGWYYDLSALKSKKLVCHARGARGGERVQIQFEITGDKPFGSSLTLPVESKWQTLTREWQRFELDLSGIRPEQFKRICNGFTIVVNRDMQEGANETSLQIYLDDIWLE